jgi:hypothetical protein
VAILATLIFGRFVCGWGCHILALQDFCAWMLITPLCPQVLNACPATLRGSCGNSVTRTGRPGKALCRTETSAVYSERETCGICLDSHLNHRRGCRGLGLDRYW